MTTNTPEERTAFIQYMRLMSDDAIVEALAEANERSDGNAVALLQDEAKRRRLHADGDGV